MARHAMYIKKSENVFQKHKNLIFYTIHFNVSKVCLYFYPTHSCPTSHLSEVCLFPITYKKGIVEHIHTDESSETTVSSFLQHIPALRGYMCTQSVASTKLQTLKVAHQGRKESTQFSHTALPSPSLTHSLIPI